MNKQEIAARLIENHQKFADYVAALDERDFMFAPAGKWTAGQQLEHIFRGVSPVKMALSLPKLVPRVLFGKLERDPTGYDELVADYRNRLAMGGKASDSFIPPEIGFEMRQNLRHKVLKTVGTLTRKIERFSEAQLDALVLPHPILGKLSMREMLYFTIYHAEHHHRAAISNLENS